MSDVGEESMDRLGLIGTVVADKYAVERVVGQGGFGIVYRARHTIWDQPVALKFFTALSVSSESLRTQLLDQFVQEGKLMADLSRHSASIVQARDVGTMETEHGEWLPYTVLEWLDGNNLEVVVEHEKQAAGAPVQRTAEETFKILDEVARALALAHERGVAHRDIKPANLFVCGPKLEPGVTIKLLDFGIAKVMQGTLVQAQKATGMALQAFTPGYGAPEQFDRRHGATGPWSDVYAMALIFAELMTGKVIFEGEDLMRIAVASQNVSSRPTPRTHGAKCSDQIEAVCQRATAVSVADRYSNMREFWNDLSLALGHGGVRSANMTTGPGLGAGSTTITPQMGAASTDPTMMSPVSPYPTQPGALDAGARRSPLPLIVGGVALAAIAAVVVVKFALPGAPPSTDSPTGAATTASATDVAATSTGSTPDTLPAQPPEPCPDGMALIPGGSFFMGSDNEEKKTLATARPAHRVEVEPFCMDITEVTAAAYRACSDLGKCKRPFREAMWLQGSTPEKQWKQELAAATELCTGFDEALGEHPINCVDWSLASAYCSEQGKRLPSEAEWELAARGNDGRVYSWGDDPPGPELLNACGAECLAWRKAHGLKDTPTLYDIDDTFPGTAPVGSFRKGATQQGLLDMAGNVFEWTADAYVPYPGAPPEVWANQPEGERRVIRGGAFNSFMPDFSDPALRYAQDVSVHSHGIGFRCAKPPAPGSVVEGAPGAATVAPGEAGAK